MILKPTVWTDSVETQALALLDAGIVAMDLAVDSDQRQQLLDYLKLMSHWNQAFNLTAVSEPLEMVERHLLDSLSIARFIQAEKVIDAGTGAGLPGIPLAILDQQRAFVLVDSNGKKVRFVRAAVRELDLKHVNPVQIRLEAMAVEPAPVDITCRALAPLAQLIKWSRGWLEQGSRLLAMKAGLSDSELNAVPDVYNVQIQPIRPASDSDPNRPQRHLVIIKLKHTGD